VASDLQALGDGLVRYLGAPQIREDRTPNTIADPFLFALAGGMEADDVDPRAFPRVHAHHRRMAERAAVRRAARERRDGEAGKQQKPVGLSASRSRPELNQAQPSRTKRNGLDFLGFIRPN
jgi:hypothetical protein